MNINLKDWGLTQEIYDQYEERADHQKIGRVVEEHKNLYKVITEIGYIIGKVAGKLQYETDGNGDYPSVGDYVLLEHHSGDKALITEILPRKSKFSRKIAGSQFEEQVVVTNMDELWICMALNKDFNLKRLDRYTTLAWDSGATPVIILTKADLCEDIDEALEEINQTIFGIDMIVVSSVEDIGLDLVMNRMEYGKTIALLGSSGVGKSTLINKILGNEEQETTDIMADDRGKHTTTYRKLMLLDQGGIIVDTPGMKSVGLLNNDKQLDDTFKDIVEIGNLCRFSDCSHNSEPGCAIKAAIANGELSSERYNNYVKLKKEAAYMEKKLNKAALRRESKERGRHFKSHKKVKY
ncbi:ribosome small subunit-dependent GTPase A [Vallitalea okinawensis]|uniref:ribosome small subunit-dependent GTPase A n=1 Tax=Vallitalea okinawensis TaxID=2078660 RepID=UPI000CFD4BE8|nr:ribosome small subunit-dependent GTPase A [Vallitalea okinawensis]